MNRAALLSAALGLAMTACGVGSGGQPASPVATLRVGIASDPRYQCFQAAQREGTFTAYRLKVDLVNLSAGALLAGVAGGKVDLAGVDATAATFGSIVDSGLRLVAIYGTSPDFVKLVRGRGIAAGQKIGSIAVLASSPSEAAADHLVAARPDLATTAIGFKDGDPQAIVNGLEAGSVDAAFLVDPWGSEVLKAGGSLIATGGSVGYEDQQVVVAQAAWLAAHEDAVRHFNEALQVGCRQAPIAKAWSSTFQLAVRAPVSADDAEYAFELSRHLGVSANQVQTTVSQLVRGDLVPSADVLAPGCDCQRLPSPIPSASITTPSQP